MRVTADTLKAANRQKPRHRGPVKVRATAQPPEHPAYIRLPRAGQLCPYTGLTRSYLNYLILGDKPVVESIAMGTTGKNRRGIRLIVYSSLIRYLEAQRAKPNDPPAAA